MLHELSSMHVIFCCSTKFNIDCAYTVVSFPEILVKDTTHHLSPMPSHNTLPMPIADFILPSKSRPASVIPTCIG